MQVRKLGILLILLTSIATSPALSDQCSDILQFGIWEGYEKGINSQNEQSYANAMCSRATKDQSLQVIITGKGSGEWKDKSTNDICTNAQGTLKINSSYIEKIKKAGHRYT